MLGITKRGYRHSDVQMALFIEAVFYHTGLLQAVCCSHDQQFTSSAITTNTQEVKSYILWNVTGPLFSPVHSWNVQLNYLMKCLGTYNRSFSQRLCRQTLPEMHCQNACWERINLRNKIHILRSNQVDISWTKDSCDLTHPTWNSPCAHICGQMFSAFCEQELRCFIQVHALLLKYRQTLF